MQINYLAVLTCAILSMVVGSVWFGVIFGKKWMQLHGSDKLDPAQLKELQKSMGPMYMIQFLLSIFQAWVLAYYIQGWKEAFGIENALWIWAAFVMPTVAGGVMWSSTDKKVMFVKFLIQAGYYMVLFVLFGLVLSVWK